MGIGGYFGLDYIGLPLGAPDQDIGTGWLQSGRGCLACLIKREMPRKAWLPYYCCDSLLTPFKEAGVPIKFYAIGPNLEPEEPLAIDDEKSIAVGVNFFGLKAGWVRAQESRMKRKIWFDHTHDFYFEESLLHSWHFNSARKFFGAVDGARLVGPEEIAEEVKKLGRNTNYRTEHLILRHMGLAEEGRSYFQQNEIWCGKGIKQISELGAAILRRVDYASVARIRRSNFAILNEALKNINRIPSSVLSLETGEVPLCYPFLPCDPVSRESLWADQLYAPCFWPECLARTTSGFEWEKELSQNLLPLPIDQRYGPDEMERILNILRKHGIVG